MWISVICVLATLIKHKIHRYLDCCLFVLSPSSPMTLDMLGYPMILGHVFTRVILGLVSICPKSK